MPRKRKSRPVMRERPVGITLLAVLEIIAALFLLIGASALSVIGHLGLLNTVVGSILTFGGILLFIMAIVFLLTAYSFLKGVSWGWWLGIIVGGISILSIVALDLLGFVIGLILIYYLTRPYVKRWFRV